MSERVIPLTQPGPLWSQREYVACMQIGIGFAAHRHGAIGEAFHYGFPGDIGCTTVIVGSGVVRYIDHDFMRTIDWVDRCAKATGGAAI